MPYTTVRSHWRKLKGGRITNVKRHNRKYRESGIKPFTLPLNFEIGQYKNWWISGYYDFKYKNRDFRHYCLENNEGKGFNAIVLENSRKGLFLSDDLYYNLGKSSKIYLAELIVDYYG